MSASGVIETLLQVGGGIAGQVFQQRQQATELQIQKMKAQAEVEKQKASQAQAVAASGAVTKFARVAFYIMAGLAGLAVLTQARKMWKGR